MILDQLNDILYNTDHQDLNHLIAKYLKKNFASLPDRNIEDLARSCFVSKAKISNYVKKLGFSSFIEFKDECKKEALQQTYLLETYQENIKLHYLDHLMLSLQNIESSLKQMDVDKLNDLIKRMTKCEKIYLFGLGYNHLLCQYLQGEFDLLYKEIIVLDERLSKTYRITNQDLLIMISVDGLELVSKKRHLQKLQQMSQNAILLTTSPYPQEFDSYFTNRLVLDGKYKELNDRKFIMRYLMDVIIRRYQYLYD